jgi:hypothetical protein
VYRALRIVRDAGITFRPTWVAFTPWTTLEDYLDMLEFVEAEGLIDHVDAVQYTLRLLVPPGSALLAREAIKPYLGPLNQGSFSFSWTHPDQRMDHLQQEASHLVEAVAKAEEDPGVTFYRLRELAHATLGVAVSPRLVPPPERHRPPRLTEAWFC